jgi:superfamily II DNA or RNA helicase
MKYQFALLLQEHKKYGLLIHPFIISDEGKSYFQIEARLSANQNNDFERLIDESHKNIIRICENFSEKNIARRFTNKNLNARDFLQQVTPDYIARHIRPFIEKQLVKIIDEAKSNGFLLFRRETKNAVYKSHRVKIETTAAEVVFNFQKHPTHTRYFQTIIHNGETIAPMNKSGIILTNDPCLLLLENRLFHFRHHVDGKKLAAFFDKEYIIVPQKHEKKYYSTFIKKCIRDFSVTNEGFEIQRTVRKMQPVLSIEDDFEGLPGLILAFDYGEGGLIAPGSTHRRLVKLIENGNEYSYEVFERDTMHEERVISFLHHLGLKKIFENIFRLPENSDKNNLIVWLSEQNEKLKAAGIKLIQQFYEVQYFTETLKAEVQFNAKNDWFDIEAVAHFGNEFAIPFFELRHHILNNIREFVLPDGRVAILPEQWFIRYSDLVSFGRKAKNNIRVEGYHAGLVQKSANQIISISRKKAEFDEPIFIKEKPSVPAAVKAQLRSYQLDGFYWMAGLHKHRLGGCLADDMGLGKTLQTLTMLAHHFEKRTDNKLPNPLQNKQMDLFTDLENEPTGNPSLVIMPASLIHNWQNEIKKFAPHITSIAFTGAARLELLPRFHHYHLVLATYGTVRNDFEELVKFQFDYIILDESQMIKNPSSKTARAIYRLRGKHRIALSGTPIENNLTDLWSQMHFLNPGLLRDLKFFKKYFANPIEKNNDEEKKNKLQLLIQPFLLRRTKKEVEKELPELSEEFVFCEMTKEQSEFYNNEKIKVRNYILESIEKLGINKSSVVVLQALIKLRQIAGHPLMVDNAYKEGSGKFNEVIRNLETLLSEGHKILVFSSFVKHLQIFSNYFDEQKIKYAMLTGRSKDRAQIIKEFQEEADRNVFFLSLKAGGTGLNLTEAEYVFMLDPWWNPQAENQAINRAHRIGQTRHVFVYRFISLATVEEKIISLQRKKSTLAEWLLKTNNPLKSMSVKQINSLIE